MPKADDLRQKALELLKNKKGKDNHLYQMSLEELVEELSIYQIELEYQNKELIETQEKLFQEKERYTEFFNKSPLGYIIVNKDFIVTDINNTACDLLAIPPNLICNKRIEKHIAPESQDELYLFLRKAFKDKLRNSTVISFLDKKKHKIHTRIFSLPENELVKIAILDISNEMAITEIAERNASLLHEVQNAGHLGIWTWYIEKNRVEWNDEMYKLFGLEKENVSGDLNEIIGRSIHPDDRETVEKSNLAVINNKKPQELEYRVVWPDGSIHYIEAHAGKLIFNNAGEPIELSGIARDICTRKHTEKALAESQRQYHIIAEKATDVVWLMDLKGKSLFVSPSVINFTGYTEEEYLNQTIEERFTEESAKIARKSLEQELFAYTYIKKLPKNYSKRLILDYKCKDGEIKTGEIIVTPFFDEESNLIGLHGVTRDITNEISIKRELEKSEKKYRELFENIPSGIYRTTPNGKILDANPALVKMLEYNSLEDLQKISVEEGYLNSKDRIHFIEYFNNHDYYEGKSQWKTKSGKSIWLEERAVAIHDENGKILYFEGNVVNITKTQIALDKLHESEKRFRHMIENAPIPIFIQSNLKFAYVNKASLKLFGADSELQLVGKNVFDFFHPNYHEEIKNRIKQINIERKSVANIYEQRYLRLDGTEVWVETSGEPIVFEGLNGAMVFARDINDKKIAETELKEKAQLLSDTGKMARIGGWQINLENNELTWSDETYKIHEVSPDQSPTLDKAIEFFHPDDQPTLIKATNNAIENGEPYDLTLRFITAKGNHLITRTMCKPEVIDGKTTQLKGTFQDITEKSKAEEEKRKSDERFRIAMDMSPDGFTILKPVFDKQGKVVDFIWVYQNASIAKLNGTHPEEVVGKRLLDLFPDHKKTVFFKTYKTVAETGKNKTIEEALFDELENKTIWFRIVVVPMIENIAILAQDITYSKNQENLISKSEEKFRFIAKNSIDVIWQMDLRLKFTYLSPSLKELTGFEPEEWIGTPLWSHSSRKEFIKMARIALRTIKNYKKFGFANITSAILKKDGSELPVEIIGKPMFDENGKIIGLQGSTRDITERIIAQENIEKKNIILEKLNQFSTELTSANTFELTITRILEHLKSFINADVLVFNRFDQNEMKLTPVKIDCNHKLLNTFEKLIGKNVFEIETQLDEETYNEMIHTSLKHSISLHQLSQGAISKAISKTFSSISGLKNFTVITFINEGSLVGTALIAQKDETAQTPDDFLISYSHIASISLARVQAEDQKRQSEKKYRKLYENNPIGLYRSTLSGEILDANTALAEMLEYNNINDLKTLQIQTGYVNPEDRNAFVNHFENNDVYEDISSWLTKSGKVIWLEERAVAVKDQHGKIKYFDGSVIDITEKRKAEIELKKRENLLNKIIDILPIGLWLADKNGKLFRSNKKGREIWGAEPLVDPSAYGVFKARKMDSDKYLKPEEWALYKTITKGETTEDEILEIEAFDNQKRIILNYTAPVYNDDNELQAAIIVNQDITELKNALEQKRKIDERFRIAQDNSPDGFTIFKPVRDIQNRIIDFTWVYQNAAVAKMNGTDPQKVVGQSFLKLFPGIKGTQFWNAYIQVAETGKSITFEDSYIGETMKTKTWFRIVVVPMKENIAIIAHNITELKKNEIRVRESEEKYRLIAENTADTITIINLDLSFAYVSPSIKKLLGYHVNEYLDLSVYDIFPKESIASILKMLNEEMELEKNGMANPDRSRTIVVQEYHKDGRLLWIESTASFIRDKNENAQSILAISRDITNEKEMAERLRESEEKFRLLAENSPFAIMIYQNNKWVYTNPAGEKISGYSSDELYSMNFWKFVHPDFMDKVRQSGQERQKGNEATSSYEFRIITKNGNIKWVYLTGTNIQYRGKDAGLVSIADITERKQQEEAIRESEIKIRSYFNHAPYGIFIANNKGEYLQVTPMASKITGYSESELLTMSIPDLMPENRKKEAFESFNELQNTGHSVYETEYLQKNGNIGWWTVSAVKLSENEYLGFVEDITKKKESENALFESRALFKTLADNSPVGIFRCNEKGETTYVNPKWCELTDLNPDEAMGYKWTKAIHPDDYDHAMLGWKQANKNQTISSSEYRFLHRNGRIVWISGRAVPEIKDGELKGYVGTITDITERKKFELSILESEASLKRAEEVAGFGNWGIDLNTKEVFASAGARKTYGFPLDKKLMLSDIQSIPMQKYRQELDRKLELLINEKEKYDIEFEIERQTDGAILMIHSIAEYDKDGNKIFGVIQDITHEREMERKLLEIEKHEKEMVQAELNKTKDALIRSTRLAAVGQVSATIAHDLRNPLGAVRNAAFYLKRKSNQHDDKILKYFNIIDSEISTADRIISNMMQMTKMKEPQKEECMLEELIEYASGSHYKDLNIEIETKILNGKGELLCDRVQIMQVLRNLLENADQSIETTTKVKIQYERKSDFTELIFSDNGPGISEDVKLTFFEPLITTKAKGTGLGLTICKQIIEKHGGHIELIDKKNAGACFRIKLPNE
ncbi:MAG: PAS domain S-box protein [Bacteroidales bacterium]|nr:PAS domain S-box protein [Bacteroidales bacterium]